MKSIPSLLLCLFLLSACAKAPIQENRSSEPKWAAPRHTSLEVYINQYKLSPTQGAIMRPDLTLWRPDVKWANTASNNIKGKPPYSATLEYKGTSPAGDHYTVTITYPTNDGFTSVVKDVVYKEVEAELFRDGDYRIGIRPRTEKDA